MLNRGWRTLALGCALAAGVVAATGVGAEPTGYTFRHSLRGIVWATDTTPDAFSIPALVDQPAGTHVQSAPVVLTGFDAPAPIAVTGGGVPTISIAGAPGVTAGTLAPGQSFTVSMTSPVSYGATAAATISVGGVSAPWNVTTQTVSATPDPFMIPEPDLADPNVQIVSSAVTPTGYGLTLPISAADGALISVASGPWVPAATIAPSQSFRVALTSGGQGTSQTVHVTVGPRTVTWTVAVVTCSPGSTQASAPGSGSFVMPRGCGTLDVDMCGGGGAANGSSNGGGAAFAHSRVTLAGGSSLAYTVAGGGQPNGQGGIGGGGSADSGSSSGPGGGGGGASWLFDTAGNPLVVAAGGGGTHSYNWFSQGCCAEQFAGSGGLPGSGSTTGNLGVYVSNGGTSSSGGSEACSANGTFGQPLAGGRGIVSSNGQHAGGGGGGGAWGGGGGSSIGQSVASGARYTSGAGCGAYGAGARLNSHSAGGSGFIRFSWAP